MTEKKPRWSTAKKASAKKAKTEKAKQGKAGKKFGDGPPAKKPRWVDGAPARPAAADRGKPRWARQDEAGRAGPGRSGERPYARDERDSRAGESRFDGDERRFAPRADRPAAREHTDRPYAGRDERDRTARPAFRDRDDRGGAGGSYRGRDDRPGSRDRGERSTGGRGYPGGQDRPGYRDRDDRRTDGGYRGRDDRPAYRDRDDRRTEGGYRGRDDRGGYRDRDDRAAGSRDNRSSDSRGYRGDDRPRGRDDRSGSGYRGRDDRPGFRDQSDRRRDDRRGDSSGYRDRDDRARGERPAYRARDDRSRGDRPAYGNRDDRRGDSSGYRDRDDRGREQRPAYRDRDDRARGERPASGNRDERPAYGERGPRRPSGRYTDGPHHEPRPVRVDRARGQWGADPARPADRVESATPPAEVIAETDAPALSEASAEPAPASTPAPAPESHGPSFAELGLPEAIVKALAARGIRAPFPIQAATIPDALAAKDLLGRGRTGSGKTMAFGLPTLARLSQGRTTANRPRALVLVPTRELALQVADALEPIARAVGVSQKVVAGGMPYPPQLTALDRGVDLVVATPGRLQDLIERGAAILDNVEIVILDEADHMADLGFLPEVTEIMDLVPEGGQRLLFSATLDKGIDELAQKYLVDPVTHSTDDPTAAVTTMEHRVLLIEPSMKKTLTAQISGRPGRTLIFVRTQLGADRVASQLRESGILAGPIHGGLNQSVRNKVLEAFKDGRLQVLVATDVAARGIHVDQVTQVVQVDPPADHKTYVHRAGRTARAGSEGSVVTLALPHQRKAMERIIDEVALSIRPERLDARTAADEGVEPTGAPVPEQVWQDIIAPRPSTRFKGRGRGPGRPRPDGGLRPRRRF